MGVRRKTTLTTAVGVPMEPDTSSTRSPRDTGRTGKNTFPAASTQRYEGAWFQCRSAPAPVLIATNKLCVCVCVCVCPKSGAGQLIPAWNPLWSLIRLIAYPQHQDHESEGNPRKWETRSPVPTLGLFTV